MPIPFEIGDIVRLKKQHPCGSKEWEIEKNTKEIRKKTEEKN